MERLNKEIMDGLAVPAKGAIVHWFAGAKVQETVAPRGFGVRVTAAGVKAFVLDYRIQRKQHRITLGRWPDWPALKAVQRARELRQQIDRGENPLQQRAMPTEVKTVGAMLDDYLIRYVRNKDRPLRSADLIESAIERLVKPRIGALGLYEVRRSHIVAMLNQIDDESGPVAADRCLAYIRKAFNRRALEDDELTVPIVPGMARTKQVQRARSRVLSDDEIRSIWPVFDRIGVLGPIAKLLLLTGQRRDEVSGMAWAEIAPDGMWTIPAVRYKSQRDQYVPLSVAALAIVQAQPHRNDTDFVFPSKVRTPFARHSAGKAKLDKAVPIPPWRLHDLRRTARSLMARLSISADIAERVLGHAMPGVREIYDRHSYAAEKRDALERLAALVGQIVGGER